MRSISYPAELRFVYMTATAALHTHTHIHARVPVCVCCLPCGYCEWNVNGCVFVCVCVYVSEDQCVPILIVLIDKWVKFVIYTHLYSHKYLIACVLVKVSSCSYIMYIHSTYVHMNLTDSIYIITKLRSRDCFNARNFSNSRNEAISLTHTHKQSRACTHTHTLKEAGRLANSVARRKSKWDKKSWIL